MEILQNFLLENPILGVISITMIVAIICVSLAFILSKNEINSKFISIRKKENSEIDDLTAAKLEDRLVYLLDELQRNSYDMYEKINEEKREKLDSQVEKFEVNFKTFNTELKDKIFDNEKNIDPGYKQLFGYWLDYTCSDKISTQVISYIKKNNFRSKSSEELEEIVMTLLSSIKGIYLDSFDIAPSFITNINSAKKAINGSMNKLKEYLSDTFFHAKQLSNDYEKRIENIKEEFNKVRVNTIKGIFPDVNIKKFIKSEEAVV